MRAPDDALNSFPLAPKLLNVSVTRRCPARCSFCATDSGPDLQGPDADSDEVAAWVADALDTLPTVLGVCIAGGEPFLRPALIERIATLCHHRGRKAIVVTNAFWAIDGQHAERTLARLRDAGLTRLTVSADPTHAEWIPVERVDHAIVAARAVGLLCNVHSVEVDGRSNYAWLQAMVPHLDLADAINTFLCLPAGRGAANCHRPRGRTSDRCRLAVSSPALTTAGDLYACCGVGGFTPPLLLGSVREARIEALLRDAASSPLLLALAMHGPGELLALALPEMCAARLRFVDTCDLCRRLLASRPMARLIADCVDRHRHLLDLERRILIEKGRLP